MQSNSIARRGFYLAAAAVSMLFAGIIYAWSILKAPLAAEFGWNPQQLTLNFTLTMCFFCIGGLVTGLALKKISLRTILILSGIMVGLGFFLSSRCTQNGLVQLYLSYGVLCGCGIGMAYNGILSAANAWFPDKKGTSSGVQMMAFGASSLILGNLSSSLIANPDFGWRKTFLLLGLGTGIVLILAAFVLRFPPADTVFPKGKSPAAQKEQEDFEPRDYTTGEMIRRFPFWRFFLFSVTMAAVGNTVISSARDMALSVGASVGLATLMVGVLAICNGLGRLLSGALFDAVGRRRTMLIGNLITILAPAALLVATLLSSVPLIIAGLCLAGLSYGFSPPISSAFILSFYGQKNFSMNFSIANTMLIPTSFVATLGGSIVSSTGSYVGVYVLLLVFSVISLLLDLSIKRP